MQTPREFLEKKIEEKTKLLKAMEPMTLMTGSHDVFNRNNRHYRETKQNLIAIRRVFDQIEGAQQSPCKKQKTSWMSLNHAFLIDVNCELRWLKVSLF